MSQPSDHIDIEPTPELQCRYRGRKCLRPRAWTVSNRRHTLCDHHRRLANETQQRWQQRRLEQLRSTRQASPAPLNPGEAEELELFDQLRDINLADTETMDPIEYSGTYAISEPSEEDMQILRELLGVEDDDVEHDRAPMS